MQEDERLPWQSSLKNGGANKRRHSVGQQPATGQTLSYNRTFHQSGGLGPKWQIYTGSPYILRIIPA
jgi:hypothetical protein